MKKRRLLFILPLISGMLAGCSIEDLMFWKKKDDTLYIIQPTIKGGTKDEQTAILEAINFKPICYPSGATSSIYPDKPATLKEDKGDNIFLAKRVLIGDKTVNIEWKVDKKQEYYSDTIAIDKTLDYVEIAYKGAGVDDGKFNWAISKISCGGASSVNDSKLKYSAKVRNFTYVHDIVSIADLNKVTDGDYVQNLGPDKGVYKFKSRLDIIDYEPKAGKTYSPYFAGNNPGAEADYYYVGVKGKLVYYAPDGNWGIIADGDQYMEIYAGSKGTPLTPAYFPRFKDQYVCVYGNMSQYCGNIQLSFIDNVRKIDPSEIEEPELTFNTINESFLAGIKNPVAEGYDSDKQFVYGLGNSLGQVTGTFISSSLKDSSGNDVTPENLKDNRFTFELQVGSQRMVIAYDYHVNRNAETDLFTEYKNKLKQGGQMTIKGTLRYGGNDSRSFVSLAYEPVDIADEDEWDKLIEGGATICTRSGDVFTEATHFVEDTKYYKFSDLNSGARWNLVPFASGHIS